MEKDNTSISNEGSNVPFSEEPGESGVMETQDNQEVVALNRAEQISQAQSFSKLFEIISCSGNFNTSVGVQRPSEVIGIINAVIRGEGPINAVTSTDGLRNKVIRLMVEPSGKQVYVSQEAPSAQPDQVEVGQEAVSPSTSEKVAQASSFEELEEIINKIGLFYSSTGVQTASEVIGYINGVRNTDRPVNSITRSHGLRDKVIELMARNKKVDKSAYGWIDRGSMPGSGSAEDLSKF